MEGDKSWIDGDRLKEVCDKAGVADPGLVDKLAKYFQEGADIGCQGEGQLATNGSDVTEGPEFGAWIVDSIQTCVKDRICIWPLRKDEISFYA